MGAAVFVTVLDISTALYISMNGGVELNPYMIGKNLIFWKFLAICVIAAIAAIVEEHSEKVVRLGFSVPAAFAATSLVAVVNNVTVISRW